MALDYHLERRIRLNPTSQYKSLYQWSLSELGDHDEQVGRDQVPWRWTQYFTAIEIVMRDELEVKAKIESESPISRQEEEVNYRRSIHASLRSGDPRSDRHYFSRTAFKMFGTDREIEDFSLDIYPLKSEEEQEECTAYGIVSYDSPNDFHPETTDDVIGFYLMVKPSTFEHYVRRISAGTADEVILAVGHVDGFYSEWSPDIVTREIKVLTGHDDQKIEAPPGTIDYVPRMRFVGDAKIYMNATRKKAKRAKPADDDDDEPVTTPLVRPEVADGALPAAVDTQLPQTLAQLRTLARWVIGLLVVLIAVTLLKR